MKIWESLAFQKTGLVLLGIFLALVLVESGLRIGGFICLSLRDHSNRESMKEGNTYRILCLGESMTFDVTKYSYPYFLEKILNEADTGVKFSVINGGIPGTNTREILSGLRDNLDKYKPDMVVTMMGINDDDVFREYAGFWNIPCLGEMRVCKLALYLKERILKRIKKTAAPRENNHAIPYDLLDRRVYYVEHGKAYQTEGKYREGESMLKLGIKLDKDNLVAYMVLAQLYVDQKRWEEAEAAVREGLERCPMHDRLYATLIYIYEQSRQYQMASDYHARLRNLRMRYYNKATRENYMQVRDITSEKGIRLVAVQYPLRDVAPLEKMLTPYDDITFVDNEGIFKEALKHKPYEAYFKDRFAGDFGHCTPLGNELLARNIAETILRECFANK
ncbi:MAG: tetratricopeptide repeat protein [Candidatus Omnitrophota bacterium]